MAKEGDDPFRTVFTIHNLGFGADLIARAMQACDVATTVVSAAAPPRLAPPLTPPTPLLLKRPPRPMW